MCSVVLLTKKELENHGVSNNACSIRFNLDACELQVAKYELFMKKL